MAFFILFLSNVAFAQDSWFCTQDSSRRNGSVIQTCGVAEYYKDEGLARTRALEHAIREFKMICELSEDCKDRKIIVEPKRTDCETKNDYIKCYRMVEVTILE